MQMTLLFIYSLSNSILLKPFNLCIFYPCLCLETANLAFPSIQEHKFGNTIQIIGTQCDEECSEFKIVQ